MPGARPHSLVVALRCQPSARAQRSCNRCTADCESSRRCAIRCHAPHEQRVRVHHAPSNFSLSFSVACSPPLRPVQHACEHDAVRGAEQRGRCPVPLSLGSNGSFRLRGLWPGAGVAAEELPPEEAPAAALADLSTADVSPPCGGDGACEGEWEVAVRGSKLGPARVAFSVAGHPSCASLPVAVRVRHAGFVAACPSSQLALGASMRCHALPAAVAESGAATDPAATARMLDGATFEWRTEGGLAVVEPPAAASASREAPRLGEAQGTAARESAASVVVTGIATGRASLRLRASSAPDEYTDSLAVLVRPRLRLATPPELQAAHADPPVVPPNATVQLEAEPSADAEARRWHETRSSCLRCHTEAP